MAAEYDFLRSVDDLSKTSNRKLYKQKAKELIKQAFTRNNAFYPYRLALELDRKGYPITELEDYIISISNLSRFNLRYLILLPLNLFGANVSKLQKAVIETNDAELMAEFANVPYADIPLLEEFILDLKVPKASFIFLNSHKSSKLSEHKKILLKSKRSRYIYKCVVLAKNKEEFGLIEDLLLKNKSTYFMRLITNLPFADLRKIEDKIIATGNFEEIKKLYKTTKSQRLAKYMIIM